MAEQPLPERRPPTLVEAMALGALVAAGVRVDPEAALAWRRLARLRGEDGRRVVAGDGGRDG